MIGKGTSIAQTKTSIAYGWNQEKDAEVIFSQNLVGENPTEISQEFRFIQSQNADCQKNTLSFILSPTIEDGQKLRGKDLEKICSKFMKEMKLNDRQSIGFVHRDKEHVHIHLYVNRIDFRGNAYNNSFLSRRCHLAAEQVAKQMNLTTVREAQMEKLNQLAPLRNEIKRIHDNTMERFKPKSFDEYIKGMKTNDVKVIPSINKAGNLQGFRFEYKDHNLKGSDIHRSLSAGNLGKQLYGQSMAKSKNISPVKILGNTVPIASNLALSIAKKIAKRAIKHAMDTGIEI